MAEAVLVDNPQRRWPPTAAGSYPSGTKFLALILPWPQRCALVAIKAPLIHFEGAAG